MKRVYKKLLHGVSDFYTKCTANRKLLFERLAKKQNPHTFFITCADSRIVPSLITATDLGELFILRNVGNVVPPYVPEHYLCGEAAALEFALLHLDITDLIICGHSNCGAIHACCKADTLPKAAALSQWIEAIRTSLDHVKYENVDDLAKLHVLQQLKNLRTYPIIQQRIKDGTLKLHAWFFDIAKALIYVGNEKNHTFHNLV